MLVAQDLVTLAHDVVGGIHDQRGSTWGHVGEYLELGVAVLLEGAVPLDVVGVLV